MSKAFDKVWHDGLIFKLKQNGVSGKLLSFFTSYLSNRKQRVVLNGSFSDVANIESGVPQGSVLGPLLFLVYINDLENNVKSNVKFFADDTMLYSVVNDPLKAASDLNHDLNIIGKWAHQWKMAFNPDPNKQANEILFSCKKNDVDHPVLLFNGSPVQRVSEHKHLGLILQPSLLFEKHVMEKIRTANRNIGIIKHLNKYLPFKTLNQMYKSLVRSHLDYCDIIFHLPSKMRQPPLGLSLHDLMEKLEMVQYKAALAVTGAWQGSNRVKLYEELGWESLSDRRMSRRVLQLHKILDEKTPKYLRNKLPPSRNVIINLPNLFHDTKCRTDRYRNSFFPDATSTWNHVISHFETMPTFLSLKSHLISLFRPNFRSTFDLHRPLLRYLFQLRVGLSKLRSHKKRHNFEDTPTDICLCKKGVEDTNHYLLVCPFFASQRRILTSSIGNILTENKLNANDLSINLLLYGHELLPQSENSKVLNYVLNFIESTNRLLT